MKLRGGDENSRESEMFNRGFSLIAGRQIPVIVGYSLLVGLLGLNESGAIKQRKKKKTKRGSLSAASRLCGGARKPGSGADRKILGNSACEEVCSRFSRRILLHSPTSRERRYRRH